MVYWIYNTLVENSNLLSSWATLKPFVFLKFFFNFNIFAIRLFEVFALLRFLCFEYVYSRLTVV